MAGRDFTREDGASRLSPGHDAERHRPFPLRRGQRRGRGRGAAADQRVARIERNPGVLTMPLPDVASHASG